MFDLYLVEDFRFFVFRIEKRYLFTCIELLLEF